MNQAEFLARWESEKPIYEAWADFINQKLHETLQVLISPISVDYFLKIPVKPRRKTDAALVDKALNRKQYKNPYDDVTDKIGMRFVVLLTSDIKNVCDVIDAGVKEGYWDASKDRDYEQERLDKPLEFTYQSVHYVLKAKNSTRHLDQTIPVGTSCEIQIRTLLQHAHSELTHDTLYKPKSTAKPEIRRTVAKSMALIEATDDFFEKAIKDLDEAAKPGRDLFSFLSNFYLSQVGAPVGQEKSNQLLIDACLDFSPSAPYGQIADFVMDKNFVIDKIRERRVSANFYTQPVVLLVYYLAQIAPARLKAVWPMENSDLAQIFSDLGKRFED